ncbi:MAG: hypothetical protein H6605_05260 [Flavobacteriales bacterium]|nr:hypothetical protein [Flavobacteriales bacterium]
MLSRGFFILLLFIGCSLGVRKEKYFIPENYEGNVIVVFESKSKKNLFSEKSIIFNIPDSGILIAKKPFYEGNYYTEYFQKNKTGTYDTLFEEVPGMSRDTAKNRVYFPRTLTIQEGKKAKYFIYTFYVGKKKKSEIDKERFSFERELTRKWHNIARLR